MSKKYKGPDKLCRKQLKKALACMTAPIPIASQEILERHPQRAENMYDPLGDMRVPPNPIQLQPELREMFRRNRSSSSSSTEAIAESSFPTLGDSPVHRPREQSAGSYYPMREEAARNDAEEGDDGSCTQIETPADGKKKKKKKKKKTADANASKNEPIDVDVSKLTLQPDETEIDAKKRKQQAKKRRKKEKALEKALEKDAPEPEPSKPAGNRRKPVPLAKVAQGDSEYCTCVRYYLNPPKSAARMKKVSTKPQVRQILMPFETCVRFQLDPTRDHKNLELFMGHFLNEMCSDIDVVDMLGYFQVALNKVAGKDVTFAVGMCAAHPHGPGSNRRQTLKKNVRRMRQTRGFANDMMSRDASGPSGETIAQKCMQGVTSAMNNFFKTVRGNEEEVDTYFNPVYDDSEDDTPTDCDRYMIVKPTI